jgi:hypothetical protein
VTRTRGCNQGDEIYYEEPKGSQIREILRRNGYSLHNSVEFDDWYLIDMLISAFPMSALHPKLVQRDLIILNNNLINY